MIRFVDIRGQGTGHRFAFWNTVTDAFICIDTEYAWDSWDEFATVAEGNVDVRRFGTLCPKWVHEAEKDHE
jgi:hypothetical protein